MVAIISLLVGLFCINRTFLRSPLLPSTESVYPWVTDAASDSAIGGGSEITVNDTRYSLDFDFNLRDKAEFPFTVLAIVFGKSTDKPDFVNLSKYQSLTFSVRCAPENTLTFVTFTFDELVTKEADLSTYRIPTTFFSCSENWSQINIDLTRLKVPQWWFTKFNLDLSHQDYDLNKVLRITFGNSFQSPYDIPSNVQIDELVLHGTNWKYLYGYIGFLVVLWGILIFWIVKQHTKSVIAHLKDKIQKDRPLIAYQQLSLEPQRNSEKDAILKFMATEYANADLNLDTAVASLGVNRTKLNDILKEELGFTFVAYLNKIRLTEAARLLNEREDMSITEVAYSVGYKNVSYFNKLFKNEYECTPKAFKNSYKNEAGD